MHKVYWFGRCASPACPINTPLGKLHAEGLQLLQRHGWVKVGPSVSDDSLPPVFAFTTRRGADFPATGPGLPKIRQLPQQCSAALDDKRRMWECLAAAGEAGVTPHTIANLEAFLQQHSQPGGAVADGGAPEASFLVARGFEEPLPPSQQQGRQPPPAGQHGWFLKHRRGVKGQAVHYLPTTAALLERLQGLSAHSRRALVAQAAVPPLLLRGRKFVLRAHVLLRLLAAAGGESSRLAAYVHEDIIVLEHASEYAGALDADRAAHISSCGKCHPKPYLLSELQPGGAEPAPAETGCLMGAGEDDGGGAAGGEAGASAAPPLPLPPQQLRTPLQRSLWRQICVAAEASVRAGAAAGLLPCPADPEAVLFELLGYDFIVEDTRRVWLLEVNAYPAIASGTMAGVDRAVFTGLIGDLLRLVVLPATDGVPPEPGGFAAVL